MTRTLSPAGLHLIAGFEGFVPTPYNDPAGNATIGYGRLLHVGPVTDVDRQTNYVNAFHLSGASTVGRLTVEQALQLLRADTASFARAVDAVVKVRLGVIPARASARFAACCSLAYNIGAAAFANSTLLKQINAKGAPRDWTELGPYWLEWDHAGGVVEPGLLERRKLEFAIFDPGKYPEL
ncbi:MAG TPA: lysozyme [Candidatus Elarobacter sp.]|jgi:lysozyme